MPDVLDHETEITKLRSAITEKNQEAATKMAEADKLRDDMASSGVDLSSLHERDAHAFEKIDEVYKEADLAREHAAQLQERLDKVFSWTGRTRGATAGPAGPAGRAPANRSGTLGRRYIDSDVWQRAKQTGANSPPEGAAIKIDGVSIMTREELIGGLRYRAGLDLGSGQALVTPEFQLIPPVELPVRPVRLIDIINVETTDTDAVVWTKQTQRVLASQPTPTGVNAPQATLSFTRVTSNVKRIPVILTAPKEALEDEGRLQGILDRQLMQDTAITVENQALDGDGTGENFPGILQESGIGSSAKLHGDYDLDAIHRGITFVRLHLFLDPDAIGLHPVDLEHIMLQRDTYGRYIFEPSSEQSRIWGFPAVSTPVFSAGTGLVGNYRMGATMWVRSDVVVTATDGYTDVPSGTNYFSAGLVAIMAQVRAAFATERDFAFCEVTGLGTTP